MKLLLISIRLFLVYLVTSPLSAYSSSNSDSTPALKNLYCEISIIGGGPAGLYMAYKLGPIYKDKLCLFEKESRLGGRIYDVSKDPNSSDGPYFAVGSRRVMETQVVLFDLAKELGITLEVPSPAKQLIYAKGMYSLNPNDFVKLYPGVSFDASNTAEDAPTQLLQRLLKAPQRIQINQHQDLRSYVNSVLGTNYYEYLRDMSRFRSDYEYELSAKAYLEYLDEDIKVCCIASYPVNGMTSFARGLVNKAQDSGVRIYTGQPIKSIDKNIDKSVNLYTLTSSQYRIQSQSVIIAVPPKGFDYIQGDIARAIQMQEQYKSLVGVNVVTVAQWYDNPWWLGIKDSSNQKVWRAWTTDSCINSIEIPQEAYAVKQNVIRSVYSDRLDCVKKFRELSAQGSGALEQEIKKGLEHLFSNNGVTHAVQIGDPSKTLYWEWPDAWHYIRAGYPFSTNDIFNWAVKPLPNENIALVGESYNPQRASWSDGAYKSAINLLNLQYGFSITYKK